MSLTAPLEEKIQWLASTVKTVLDAHGYGSFNVETFVRGFMLRIDTRADISYLMGDPIRYARVWFDGVEIEPRDQGNPLTAYGSFAKVSHRLGVLLEFQFEDAESESESSDLKFRYLLEREEEGEPEGLLVYLRNLGGSQTPTQTFEIGIESIALPSMPIESVGGGDSHVHYMEFTITLT